MNAFMYKGGGGWRGGGVKETGFKFCKPFFSPIQFSVTPFVFNVDFFDHWGCPFLDVHGNTFLFNWVS